tara:strand:- start:44 stop:925 length:882 start_codon:yes stop_codon:yes gene_type:complete
MLFTKPKVNASGGKSIGVLNSKTRRSVLLNTPLMLTWGVNVFDNPNGKSYNLALQFPRKEFSNKETDDFLDMLKEMEKHVLEEAVKNSKEWFGKVQSKEVIEAFWNPMLKYPKGDDGEPDPTRNPTLKVKLQTWDGEYKFELFDVNNVMLIPNSDNKSPEDFIQKGANIACMLQCGGVWFANGNFGVTWKLSQGIVKPTETLAKGRCHISLSSKDREEISNDKSDEFKEENNNTNDTVVESDDEAPQEEETGSVEEEEVETASAEEEAEVEPEPEPEPEPEKPKKKRVVKKKS